MHCTLLIPDLLPAVLRDAPDARPYTPCLSGLLARGNTGAAAPGSMESWLCDEFSVRRQHDWPVAPLTLAGDGGDAARGYWLRCDPVHFYTRQNRIYLSDAAGTPSAAESQGLVDALNTHFHTDGLLFYAGGNGRWYVRTETHSDLTTQPLSTAVERDIDTVMPTGADSRYWRSILNEVQMLLHAHPLNAEREMRGLPVFNSIWLWGGGTANAAGALSTETRYNRVWADEPLARALAAHTKVAASPLPPTTETVLAAGGDALVVIDAFRDAARDLQSWQKTIETFEQHWIAPCYAALKKRRIALLTLVVTDALHYRRIDITPANLWRWWRRLKSPAGYA